MQLLMKEMNARRGAPGFLIDGFPRTMEQALVFERTVGLCSFVLYFDASHETLIKRLLKRGESSGRADDNLESIKKRLETFSASSLPVIKHFDKDHRVRKVLLLLSYKRLTQNVLLKRSQKQRCHVLNRL
jgi:adenylate kinase family enzyme